MARKITTDAVHAFMNGENFSRDNTQVRLEAEVCSLVHLYLHGNLIAKRFKEGDKTILMVSNAGWQSNTTKERLNGLPGVSVCQRKGVWYLNGVEWDGSWKTV